MCLLCAAGAQGSGEQFWRFAVAEATGCDSETCSRNSHRYARCTPLTWRWCAPGYAPACPLGAAHMPLIRSAHPIMVLGAPGYAPCMPLRCRSYAPYMLLAHPSYGAGVPLGMLLVCPLYASQLPLICPYMLLVHPSYGAVAPGVCSLYVLGMSLPLVCPLGAAHMTLIWR